MGVSLMGKPSCSTAELTWPDGFFFEEKIVPSPLPNPDPENYEILRTEIVGRFLVMKIKYPDCVNYEGTKILVFRDVKMEALLEQGAIDPHFCENEKFISPIARFIPDINGWIMAVRFCEAMEGLLPPATE